MAGEWETGFKTPEREIFHDVAVAYGGTFHGPNVETLSISEQDFYTMMEHITLAGPLTPQLAAILSRQKHRQAKEQR